MNRNNLVLLPPITLLSKEEIDKVCSAEWYETENGILVADVIEIGFLSEADPQDAGVDSKKATLRRIPHCLKRFHEDDGFYHA